MIGIEHYLTVGAILFVLGVLGIFLNRKNVIVILMAVELILLAVNINLVACSSFLGDLVGQVFALLVLTVAAVLVLELLNTATEAVVDLAIGRRFHPLARIAKDCAAAAVLVAAISSLVIAILLLLPPLLVRLGV